MWKLAELNKQINDFNQFVVPKITTYDRAPFEYEDNDYFSGYARQLEDYNQNIDKLFNNKSKIPLKPAFSLIRTLTKSNIWRAVVWFA